MKNILSTQQAIKLSQQLKTTDRRLVLVGGCFDILHSGHIIFLQKAKQKGDVLFVWVESDQKVKDLKGPQRPIHTQQDRAFVIANLKPVDYVIMLPFFTTDSEYDDLVKKLKPAIIATTKGDPHIAHKKRQAKESGSKVVAVTDVIANYSSSRLAKRLFEK